MRRSYLGAVMGEPGSYGIVFRDFPGCVSEGDTCEEVLSLGADALQGHIETMLDAGDFIPAPTHHDLVSVAAWLDDPKDPIDETWIGLFPIEIDIPERPDSVTIRMKAALVERIAEISARTAIRIDSRDFIERAVEHELERYRKSA